MSGPPPKDPSLRRRRNATPGFKLLPHEGRQGPPPKWPLPLHLDMTIRQAEEEKWAELWALPQAVEWERMREYGTVALYVRAFCEASLSGMDSKLLSEVRQLDTKIGLSAKSMRDLRWEIDEPMPEPEPVPEAPAEPEKPKRVLVVKDGG